MSDPALSLQGVIVLVLILYLGGEAVALTLAAMIGKRVGMPRRFLIATAMVALVILLLVGW